MPLFFFTHAVPRFRFSRQGLNNVSVSVVNIAVGETDGAEPTLEFAASSMPLPVVEGTAHRPLPAGCSISSLEFNSFSGWVTNNFTGFSLATHNSALYLEVTSLMYMVTIKLFWFHRLLSYQMKELSYFRLSL